MITARTLVRPAISAVFISGGVNALRSVPEHTDAAQPLIDEIALRLEKRGITVDPKTLVRANGAIQVGAGVLLALGRAPRLSATLLAASLVPTTLAGHRFWERQGEERGEQQMHFFKNLAIVGGLLSAALDTGGRPSVFWAGRRAADRAAQAIADQARHVTDALPPR